MHSHRSSFQRVNPVAEGGELGGGEAQQVVGTLNCNLITSTEEKYYRIPSLSFEVAQERDRWM